MAFKEFQDFGEVKKYLKEQGTILDENSTTNIKSLFEHQEDFAIGIQFQFCPLCNTHSDGGGIMMAKRGTVEKDEPVLKMMCMNCNDLSKLLIIAYKFDSKDVHRIMDEIRKIKEEQGI